MVCPADQTGSCALRLAADGALWLQEDQSEVRGAAAAQQGSSGVHHGAARWLKAQVCLISSNRNSSS